MHIFKADRPLKVASINLGFDFLKTIEDGVAFGSSNNAYFCQHSGVRTGALDVIAIQALVKINRGCKRLDEGVGGLGKTPAPRFICTRLVCHSNIGCLRMGRSIPESTENLGRYSHN